MRMCRHVCAALPWLLALGCASGTRGTQAPALATATAAESRTPICEALRDRFIGLPAQGSARDAEVPPLAGRWWLRHCHTEIDGSRVLIHANGPAWYWVDHSEQGIRLRQELDFSLDLSVAGRFEVGYEGAVASLWFRPDSEAAVRIERSGKLALHGDNLWGSLARRVPLLGVAEQIQQRIEREGAAQIRRHLRRGFTVTYEVLGGRPDASLGMLRPGRTPAHPFANEGNWAANERQLVYPGGVHVTGPFEPAESIVVDFRIESGIGVAYRPVCHRDLRGALTRGALDAPKGDVSGVGDHRVELRVRDCSFYLLTTALGETPSVVSLKVSEHALKTRAKNFEPRLRGVQISLS